MQKRKMILKFFLFFHYDPRNVYDWIKICCVSITFNKFYLIYWISVLTRKSFVKKVKLLETSKMATKFHRGRNRLKQMAK